MESNGQACYLHWGHGKFSKTIQFDKTTNVPTLLSAASVNQYNAHKAAFAWAHPFYHCETVWIQGRSPAVNPSKLLVNKDTNVHITNKGNNICEGGKSQLKIVPICQGPLTFTFLPHPSSDDDTNFEAKTFKPSWCNGTIALAISCVPASSTLQEMGRFGVNSEQLCGQNAQAAFLAPWLKCCSTPKLSPTSTCSLHLLPANASLSTNFSQHKLDS